MPYNYQRDFYGSDDYYGDMRDAARDRLSDTIVRSGRNLGGIYDAQLEGNELAQIQAARDGAAGSLLGGAAMGANFGPVGGAVGAGVGALSGGMGSYEANRKLGKGVGGSLIAAVGDVLSPGNMLKSPMLMPALGAAKGLMPKQDALGSYLHTGEKASLGGSPTAVYASEDPFTFSEAQDFAAQGNAESFNNYDPVTGKRRL